MKVLVVNNTVFCENEAGLCVYKETGKFFAELRDLGHEVHLLQMSMKKGFPYGPGINFGIMSDYNLLHRGFHVKAVKRRRSRLWAYVRLLVQGLGEIGKADFVYLFYPGHICSVLAVLSLVFKKPYGFYIRGQRQILSKISRLLYPRAAVILTISPEFTQMIERLGVNANTIRPMMDYGEEDLIRDRIYGAKEKVRILFVGRIEKDKGVFELLESVRLLLRRGVFLFTVHLVGDGVDAPEVRSLIEKEALQDYFVLHGMVDDRELLADQYQQADLFVLPTHHEGFPRVLYEAMLFGVPILTTFVGGIPFLMRDRENCYRFFPKDPEGLSHLLEEIMGDYENKAVVARAATQTIESYLQDKKESHARQLSRFLTQGAAQ